MYIITIYILTHSGRKCNIQGGNIDFWEDKRYNGNMGNNEDNGLMRLKKAFTLAELMIVFIVIGIIISLGVSTVRPWEKAYKYAYLRIYNALSLSIYNHMVNTSDDDAFPTDANKLCEALLEYINTSEHIDDPEAFCKSGSHFGDTPPTAADFTEDALKNKVTITASNGVRLWIGAKNSGIEHSLEATQVIDGTTETDKVRFFYVYADLNGDRKPNSPVWSQNQMADIVAFAITDKYIVIPLGYPEVDSRYLEAHVVYPTFDTESGDEDVTSYTGDEDITSDAMTYYEAKVQAFDLNDDGKIDTSIGNVMTYDFNDDLDSDSPFKVKHTDGNYKSDVKQNYNSHYETPPEFDENRCGMDEEYSYSEPLCNVKINDYH